MKKKSKMGGIILTILAIILVIVAIVIIKTYTYPFTKYSDSYASGVSIEPISEQSLQRFVGGLRIPTVSNSDYSETNFAPFDEFKTYLQNVYPEVYANTDNFTINEYGLVFHWKGRNPALKPLLFLSHYDVVPVLDYDEDAPRDSTSVFQPLDNALLPISDYAESWDYPAFSGAIANGRIYGRGTLDMKCMLFGIMEAVDTLIKQGFQPERDIWIAFGQDEEVGGLHGAVYIANYFKEQNITFEAVYDEGGVIATSGIQGIERPVGLIGIGEKGFLTLRIRVRGLGGHASMPPARASLVQAAEIIERLNNNQLPNRIIPPIETFLREVGGDMGFASRMTIANQWLLKPVLLKTLSKSPASNALVRTTTAITMARGSEAANVLASVAEVTVNFRLLQGDSVAGIIEHVKEQCEGYDVELEVINAREPSGISPENTRGYNVIKETVAKIYPEAIVTSYLTIGGTDAYKYQIVSDNIYRFMPLYLNEYEQRTIHNENEYIKVDNFNKLIFYFKEIMRTYDEQ